MRLLLLALVILVSTMCLTTDNHEQHISKTTETADTTTAIQQEHLVEPTESFVITAELSWYTADDDEGMDGNGITASGTAAIEGKTVAMSEEFPFGTRVIIGEHEYTCEDRGGFIEGNRIDIFVNDRCIALDNGRQTQDVLVILPKGERIEWNISTH